MIQEDYHKDKKNPKVVVVESNTEFIRNPALANLAPSGFKHDATTTTFESVVDPSYQRKAEDLKVDLPQLP